MTCPIQNLTELKEALEWLQAAVAVGERALEVEISVDARDEWTLALNRKRELLKQLERACSASEN